MSAELTTQQSGVPAVAENPFGRPLRPSYNAGAVSIEQERAIADAQGALIIAQRFPRNLAQTYADMMEACALPALAQVAFYSFPRGSEKVTGPSIRLAEELARIWGNIEFGHRELSRTDDASEVEVFCWDKQTNTKSSQQFTVKHVIDTKYGAKPVKSERDIDDLISNKAGRRLRSRILAVLPKWLSQAAQDQCRATIAGNTKEPVAVRVRRMVAAFAQYGVTGEHLEAYLDKPLDQALADDIVDLTGVFNAIRDGEPPSRWFGAEARKEDGAEPDTVAAITGAAKPAPAPAPETAEPEVTPEPEPQRPAARAHRPAADERQPKPAPAPAKDEELF